MPPGGQDAGAGAEYSFGLSIAPNGRQLVYPSAKAGVVSLWLHDLRNSETRELPGTSGAVVPFWSADGSRIGFFAGGHVRALDLASGQTSDLAEATTSRGGAWNAAGDLVFAPAANGALMRRDATGTIAPFTALDATGEETSHSWPAFLRDGRHVVFLVTATQPSRGGIWIAPLDDPSSRRRLIAADGQAIVASGQASGLKPQASILLFLAGDTLMAQPLDPTTLEPAGRASVVGINAGRGPLGQVFATASSDVLIYGAPGTTLRQLRWTRRDGEAVGSPSEPIEAWDLRIAPDGRRVAITEVDPQLRTLDVFIRPSSLLAAPTRLSLSTDLDESGVWSPDGLRIAWAGQRRKVMLRGAGAVLPEQALATFDPPVQVWDWSRDGRSLLIGRRNTTTGDDLWIQPPDEGAARPYTTAPFNQAFGVFSPDGRAIAYASDESGQFDVYVDSYPKAGSRIRVTTAGGTEPRWSMDGRELYFRRGSAVYAITLQRFEVSSITRLFDAGATIRSFDVSRDGRFLINVPAEGLSSPAATLVYHWKNQTQNHGNTQSQKKSQ